jgi:hypothetical protein
VLHARGGRAAPAFALALVLALLAAAAGVLRHLGTALVVSDAPIAADVVLVTYGVNSFARPVARASALRAAAARYARGEARAIVLGELSDPELAFSTRVELARGVLTKAGVREGDIVTLPPVESEHEEALAMGAALVEHGWTRVVAYAPDFRSRRTRGALRQAGAAAGADVRVIGVSDPSIDLARWWQSEEAAKAVLNEYPRLLYYLTRGWLLP